MRKSPLDITHDKVTEYVKAGGSFCLGCGADGEHLRAGTPSFHHGGMVRIVSCVECEYSWDEHYSLDGIETW